MRLTPGILTNRILAAGALTTAIAATACSDTTHAQTVTPASQSSLATNAQADAGQPDQASGQRASTTLTDHEFTSESTPPTTITISFTYEDTIEGMLETSEAAVIGTVVALSKTTDESGAMLMNYFEFEVSEWLVTPKLLSGAETVFVSVRDPSVGLDIAGSLSVGDSVLLMGYHISQDEFSLPLPNGGLIAPSAEGTGIFDIDANGNTATARSPLILSASIADRVRVEPEITESGEELPLPNRPPLTVSLDQIRDLVPQ